MHRPAAALILAAPLLSVIAAPAIAQSVGRYTVEPDASRVEFTIGTRTGANRGQTQRVTGWAEFAGAPSSPSVRGVFTVDVGSFDMQNRLSERQLQAMMATDAHPVSHLTLERLSVESDAPRAKYALSTLSGGGAREPAVQQVVLHGRITMKGIARSVSFPATARIDGASLRVAGDLQLRLSEFGIEPTRLAKLAGMSDVMVLHFDLRLSRD